MKESSLYKESLASGSGRSSLWIGAAIVALIGVSSLYISRAGDEKEPVKKNETAAVSTTDTTATEASPAQSNKAMSDTDLRNKLTPEQFYVTRENGTERPFHNQYWDNHAPGIYVDLISGEALFASSDKFESGSGWPSFTKPIEGANVVEKTDKSLFMARTEVRSKEGDAHLGHVFDDGPQPTGMRYCVNSAALRFIPKEKMAEEGYGKYLPQVEGPEKK